MVPKDVEIYLKIRNNYKSLKKSKKKINQTKNDRLDFKCNQINIF